MKNLLLKAMGKQMLRAVYAELLRFTQDSPQRKGERAQQDKCVGVTRLRRRSEWPSE